MRSTLKDLIAIMDEDIREAQLKSVLAECARLREENNRLRLLLSESNVSTLPIVDGTNLPDVAKPEDALGTVNNLSEAGVKIDLFRRLFRGREDVYAERWESSNGHSGYMPKADRDWKSYLASRPEDRKKIDRKTRKFRPLTDEVLRKHLLGEHTIGIYPLLPDETCWFLAVDFDKKSWELDASAFLATCRVMGVPAALERSRSGNGGHVWIFFDRAIPAATARKLGSSILTRTMEVGIKLAWIPMTDSSRIKTPCRKVGLGT